LRDRFRVVLLADVDDNVAEAVGLPLEKLKTMEAAGSDLLVTVVVLAEEDELDAKGVPWLWAEWVNEAEWLRGVVDKRSWFEEILLSMRLVVVRTVVVNWGSALAEWALLTCGVKVEVASPSRTVFVMVANTVTVTAPFEVLGLADTGSVVWAWVAVIERVVPEVDEACAVEITDMLAPETVDVRCSTRPR
jgi:hypothetical protein